MIKTSIGRGHPAALAGAVGLAFAALAEDARAQVQDLEAEEEHASADADVFVGANAGALAPQAFNELGGFAAFGIELGYALPALDRQLVVQSGAIYSQPPASGGREDGRLSGGSYAWDLDQQMLIAELGGAYRIVPPGDTFTPFAYGAGRVYMLQTRLDGESGEAAQFGEHTESFTEIGGVVGGGAEVAVGPGLATGKLGVGFSNMNQRLTGDTNAAALEFSLGYRLGF